MGDSMIRKPVLIQIAIAVALLTGAAFAWQPSMIMANAIADSVNYAGGNVIACPSNTANLTAQFASQSDTFLAATAVCVSVADSPYAGTVPAQMAGTSLDNDLYEGQNWVQTKAGFYLAWWVSEATNEGIYVAYNPNTNVLIYMPVLLR